MTTTSFFRFLTLIILLGCSGNNSPTTKDIPEEKANMSLTFLKIISTDPSYVPSKSQQDKVKALLSDIYDRKQIEFKSVDTIEFVDQGQNFDTVSCNLCSGPIEIEEWQNAMDKASERQFEDLTFTTPCCHKKTSLNDLNYYSAAGFARFIMTISDAQDDIPQKSLLELEQILQTRLRTIWAHY